VLAILLVAAPAEADVLLTETDVALPGGVILPLTAGGMTPLVPFTTRYDGRTVLLKSPGRSALTRRARTLPVISTWGSAGARWRWSRPSPRSRGPPGATRPLIRAIGSWSPCSRCQRLAG